jgi:hypothetical protein
VQGKNRVRCGPYNRLQRRTKGQWSKIASRRHAGAKWRYSRNRPAANAGHQGSRFRFQVNYKASAFPKFLQRRIKGRPPEVEGHNFALFGVEIFRELYII